MRSQFVRIVTLLILASGLWQSIAIADCALASTPNDGYFDQTWAGNGCISFDVDNRNAAAHGALEKIAVTGNGNLLVAGDTSTGSGSWWIGELTAQGAFDATFGDSDGSGLITGCQMFLPGGCPTDMRASTRTCRSTRPVNGTVGIEAADAEILAVRYPIGFPPA
jgi:hypothetical protein